MFAARDPGQKVAELGKVFEARKSAKPDDPKLTPIAFHNEVAVGRRD